MKNKYIKEYCETNWTTHVYWKSQKVYVNSYVNNPKMAQVKFYLEKRKDSKTGKLIETHVPIFLFYTIGNGQRFQHYTGQRIDMDKWDTRNMRVKGNSLEARDINEELQRQRSLIEDAHRRARANDVPVSIPFFKDVLSGKEVSAGKTKKDFLEAKDAYLEELALTRKPNTIKAVKSSLKHFVDFASDVKLPLTFEGINMDFYNRFLDWCFNSQGYHNNHTGKLIKDLKAFLGWATDNGYNSTMDFRKKSFRRLGEETEIIFLKYEELMRLFKLKLNSESQRHIRDMFCFGCFTGLRFSDIKNLRPENVHGDMLIYRVIKTGENNTVPLNKYSKEILQRNAGREFCLPVISEQKTNNYLKALLKAENFDRKVQITHFKGAKRISESYPLHDVVTFHISKKTFMTNFLAKGGSLHTAMAITGNKSFKTAKRYFTVVDTLKMEEMKRVFGD